MSDAIASSLYARLFDQAERARWTMDDVRWDRIDRDAVTPELRESVQEAAFAELTTAAATRRFLTELADDTDLTHWISIWFYEETKHPQVLLRWLHHVGTSVDEGFLRRGRGTAPFMRSRIGTLVTNVISEMVASASYARLQRTCGEPVLADIAGKLAGDEARHAASFFAFARRHLERSAELEADRRDALKVLYAWFQDNAHVRHPVNELHIRKRDRGAAEAFEEIAPRERIVQLVGVLIDRPLAGDGDLQAELRGDRRQDLRQEEAAHEAT